MTSLYPLFPFGFYYLMFTFQVSFGSFELQRLKFHYSAKSDTNRSNLSVRDLSSHHTRIRIQMMLFYFRYHLNKILARNELWRLNAALINKNNTRSVTKFICVKTNYFAFRSQHSVRTQYR